LPILLPPRSLLFSYTTLFRSEASSQGNLKAQFRLVKLFNQGYGSPRDFEDMYRWLFYAKVADANTHKKIARLLAQLAEKMPASVVARARLPM